MPTIFLRLYPETFFYNFQPKILKHHTMAQERMPTEWIIKMIAILISESTSSLCKHLHFAYFCLMNHEEIKRYFETNPPPEVVEWKPWTKISNTQVFLNSCYIGIRNFNGPPEMCPAWWHLKDFYQHVKRNLSDAGPAQPE